MKYYETNYPYYALIPARCKDDAISLYVEEIADEEDYIGQLEDDMVEITQLEAFIKFAEGVKISDKTDFTTIGSALDVFLDAHILLVDGCLL